MRVGRVARAVVRVMVVAVAAMSVSGCGLLRFGGAGSSLGDGQIDILRGITIATDLYSGNPASLCDLLLAGTKGTEAEKETIRQVCINLVAQQGLVPGAAGVASGAALGRVTGMAQTTPPAAPGPPSLPGPACAVRVAQVRETADELAIALDLAEVECSGR